MRQNSLVRYKVILGIWCICLHRTPYCRGEKFLAPTAKVCKLLSIFLQTFSSSTMGLTKSPTVSPFPAIEAGGKRRFGRVSG